MAEKTLQAGGKLRSNYAAGAVRGGCLAAVCGLFAAALLRGRADKGKANAGRGGKKRANCVQTATTSYSPDTHSQNSQYAHKSLKNPTKHIKKSLKQVLVFLNKKTTSSS